MKPEHIEAIQQQLDRVRFGKWKKGEPRRPEEACAIYYYYEPTKRMRKLPRPVVSLMNKVLRKKVNHGSDGYTLASNIVWWNDTVAKQDDVIELLDETLREAKNLEA